MAVDALKIVHAIMKGSRIRDAKGIIPLFGVYLSLYSTAYYDQVAFEFLEKMGPQRRQEAEKLLIAAAQECGYTTFHGIRQSREWEDIVQPMLETLDEQIEGFLAVSLAFGWAGKMEVVELQPCRKLHVRTTAAYESTHFVEHGKQAEGGRCFMLRGVVAAFMDLLYGAAYPEGCFTFFAREPRCQAQGDACCEFIAEKTPA